MDDAGLGGLDQAVGGLGEDACRAGGAQRAVRCDDLGERASLHVLHDEPVAVDVLDEVEDRHDVRVVDARGDPGLPLGTGDVLARHAGHEPDALDGDGPSEHLVVCEVDDAGASAADLPAEGVPACDHVSDPSRGSAPQ